MKIDSMSVRQIFDSRGEPTIEIKLVSGADSARASVPSGKSRGSREASVFSLSEAHIASKFISEIISGRNIETVRELDDIMNGADGTELKSKIGGNVMLGISVAAARLIAKERGVQLWQYLRNEFFAEISEIRRPLIFSNLINGGVHAKNNLNIQEYMIVMKTERSYEENIERLIKLYRHLGQSLASSRGLSAIPIGDEGGYSTDFRNNFEPIEMLERAIKEEGMEDICSIGIDSAASSFFEDGMYKFDGESMNSETLSRIYQDYFKKSQLLTSIEDPFSENDAEAFAKLSANTARKWIVGDDLTVTNPAFVRKFGGEKYINAVIIKPNQVGTVSEACDAVNEAKTAGVKTIISHRSGETEDYFIIELAKAGNADAVKIGAPTKDRITKFNELIRLYEDIA